VFFLISKSSQLRYGILHTCHLHNQNYSSSRSVFFLSFYPSPFPSFLLWYTPTSLALRIRHCLFRNWSNLYRYRMLKDFLTLRKCFFIFKKKQCCIAGAQGAEIFGRSRSEFRLRLPALASGQTREIYTFLFNYVSK
jgi:hypothetical protein